MDTVTPILLLFMATLLTPSWTTKTELDLGLDIQDILLTNLGLEQKIYFEWSKRGCEATELSFFERSEKKRSSMSQFFFDSWKFLQKVTLCYDSMHVWTFFFVFLFKKWLLWNLGTFGTFGTFGLNHSIDPVFFVFLFKKWLSEQFFISWICN